MRVVMCGPPQSGKSTFTASLIRIIRGRKRGQSYNTSFTWVPLDVTDNSLAAMFDDEGEVAQKRDVDWSIERAEERRDIFKGRDERLVLGDAPGLVTEELRTVIEPADKMIILASREKEDQMDEWRQVADDLDIDVFAEFTTVLHDDTGAAWLRRSERIGVLRSIEREEFEKLQIDGLDDPTRRMLRQLGTDLLNACENGEEEDEESEKN